MWTHFDFALVFAGLGYIGLWAFAAGDIARHLSPGLQAIGIAAAAVAMVRVAMLIRARQAKPQESPAAAVAAPLRNVRRNGMLRRAPKRRPPIAPREEFGLRKPTAWPKR